MRLRFTKMHGAGNDFVVLDGTSTPIALSPDQARHLADRRFGVGADQILLVERSSTPGIDFRYRIFNNTGDEVEHCGNGARCFLRFVHARGLTQQRVVKVETLNNVLELRLAEDGSVTVDMNRPVFDHERIPFESQGSLPLPTGQFEQWQLAAVPGMAPVEVAVLSMGNPHAVLRVPDVAEVAVATLGPRIESHPQFPRRVNVGFMQVLSPHEINLRVWERSAGETLACGTGACAAVVAGIRLGWLARSVQVHTRGGDLLIEWPADDAHVLMTGPTAFVFEGEIEL
jgi:diaminopimelate epimerase